MYFSGFIKRKKGTKVTFRKGRKMKKTLVVEFDIDDSEKLVELALNLARYI